MNVFDNNKAGGLLPALFCLKQVKLLLTLTFIVIMAQTLSAGEIEDLTAELVKMRSEVETLQNDLDISKNELRNAVKSIEISKAELKNEIQRENLKIKQLKLAIAQKKAQSGDTGDEEKKLKVVFSASVKDLKEYIKDSLPFKIEGRLNALKEIEDQMISGAISPFRAISRLWAFYEDEFRLTKENGIFSQPMKLDGTKRIVQIARIGMVTAYYKYGEENFGIFIKKDGKWQTKALDTKEHQKQVEYLFESLRKQIRAGYFELPVLKVLEVKK
jgi:hypothetical protein